MEGIDDVEDQLAILVNLARNRVDAGLKELDQNHQPEFEQNNKRSLTDFFTRKSKPAIHGYISVWPQ